MKGAKIMCNFNAADIQKDVDLYVQFLDLVSARDHLCTTSVYHKISEHASPIPFTYKIFLKREAILSDILTNVGFDRRTSTLHETILAKRILYFFSLIDKSAFVKNESNPNGFFDIKAFRMPAILFPLFTGIIGSLPKTLKKDADWETFKKDAIDFSKDFYKGNVQDFFPVEIPNSIEVDALYQYCLDFILPDDLYHYSTDLENTIIKANNLFPIERLNLKELKGKLFDPDTIFITHYFCKKFYSALFLALSSYNNYLNEVSAPITVGANRKKDTLGSVHFLGTSKGYMRNLLQNYEESVNTWKTKDENLALKKFQFTIIPSGN